MARRPAYSDPDLFELRCPGCGYAVSELTGIARQCPECGKDLPAGVRNYEAIDESRSLMRRRAGGVFLALGLLWVPAFALLADRPELLLAVFGAGVISLTLACIARWPPHAGASDGAKLRALGQAGLETAVFLLVLGAFAVLAIR